jgi:hypothetical protein
VVSKVWINLRLGGDHKSSERSRNDVMFWFRSRGGVRSRIGAKWRKLADRKAIA